MNRNIEFEKRLNYDPNVNYIEVVKKFNELLALIDTLETEEAKKEYRKELHHLCKTHGGNIDLTLKLDYYKRLHSI